MSLRLERLLWLAMPLFAAVSKQKRVGKSAKKKTPSAPARPQVQRAKKPARPAPRPSARKNLASAKKGAPRDRTAPPAKLPVKPAPAVPAEPAVPLPKPVAPVGRPILLSPEQGKYADSVNPKFRWLSVGGATRYEVAWGQDPTLTKGYAVISMATEAAVPVEKPLSVGVVYYWRARGGNEAGWGPWSNTGSFSVVEEPE